MKDKILGKNKKKCNFCTKVLDLIDLIHYQYMLWLYLKIRNWELIFCRARREGQFTHWASIVRAQVTWQTQFFHLF